MTNESNNLFCMNFVEGMLSIKLWECLSAPRGTSRAQSILVIPPNHVHVVSSLILFFITFLDCKVSSGLWECLSVPSGTSRAQSILVTPLSYVHVVSISSLHLHEFRESIDVLRFVDCLLALTRYPSLVDSTNPCSCGTGRSWSTCRCQWSNPRANRVWVEEESEGWLELLHQESLLSAWDSKMWASDSVVSNGCSSIGSPHSPDGY